MENKVQDNKSLENKAERLFDEILGRNLERLLGTRYGIGGLTVNIPTISCIIILAEQAKTEGGDGVARPGHYTREMLFNELTEMGLNTDEVMDTIIPDMIRRDYMEIDADDIVFIKEHTINMARTLNRIFPKMPGINLVAFLTQTLDEVQSGRKYIEDAKNYFDQALKMHGVALKKRQPPKEQKEASAPSDRQRALKHETLDTIIKSRQFTSNKIIKGPEVNIVHQKPAKKKKPAYVPTSDTATLQSEEITVSQKNIAESAVQTKDIPDTTSAILPEESHFTEQPDSPENPPQDLPSSNEEISCTSELKEQENLFSTRVVSENKEAETFQTTDAVFDAKTEGESDIVPGDQIIDGDDDAIEKKITTFEESLAMQCPICRTAGIKPQETSTGKFYYVCSDKKCTFISWGKPHHFVCPECGNPFLVESLNKDGKTVLKCPRATCIHWQKHPSEISEEDNALISSPEKTTAPPTRKKLVRRRFVRKKR